MASQSKFDTPQINNDPILPEISLYPYPAHQIQEMLRDNPDLTHADFAVPETQTEIDNLIRKFATFQISSKSLKRHGVGEYAAVLDHLRRLGLKWPHRTVEDEPDPAIRAEQVKINAVVKELMIASHRMHRQNT